MHHNFFIISEKQGDFFSTFIANELIKIRNNTISIYNFESLKMKTSKNGEEEKSQTNLIKSAFIDKNFYS